jgi:methyl-accepting chemotaxis protein
MTYFKNLKLGSKLSIIFGFILIIISAGTYNAISNIEETSVTIERITQVRVPTAQSSMQMLNGLNQALAALRGWMLLGNEKFRDERKKVWDQGINPALALMQEKSKTWTNAENIERLQRLNELLPKFNQAQQEIEDIAQTVDNVPAMKMLFEEAAPQAAIMTRSITEIIDLEAKLPATIERKQLLGMMADVRGTIGLGLANIRAYLLSGDEAFKQKYDVLWKKNERRYNELQSNKELLSAAQLEAFNALDKARTAFKVIPPEMFTLRGQKEWNIANHWLANKAAPVGDELVEILQVMSGNQQQLLQTDAQESLIEQQQAVTTSWLIFAGSVLIAIMLGLLFVLSVNKRLAGLLTAIQQLEKGNLQANIDQGNLSKDEIGQLTSGLLDMQNTFGVIDDVTKMLAAMAAGNMTDRISGQYRGKFEELKSYSNDLAEKFAGVVGSIQESAYSVKTTADEISQGNNNLSKRTEEQAASLEQTAASMEEITSTIVQNTENARQANDLASSARETAETGGKVVNTAINAMAEINESSKKMADIVNVIDEIAFQTNLLALNASVEAARAGDQGRGFAVVAGEVRNLAGRSATSAKEIKELIEDSLVKVDEGSELVNRSGENLEEIVASVAKVSTIVAEISAASEEQSVGISEINRAVTQMDSATQQNAALVEEVAAASESMGEEAADLEGQMKFFDIGSSTGASRAATVSRSKPAERRGGERAWAADTTKLAAKENKPPALKAVGDSDEFWEEF